MRKIIVSLGMIVFAGALIVGATGAFFSDTETSTGNTFAAGAIDLKIDNTSYGFDWNDPTKVNPNGTWGQNANNSWQLSDLTNQLFFDFDDLKPGDYGEDTISLHVNDNDAWACMAFDLTSTPENGQTEPEAAVDQTAGANDGELQKHLSFIFWNDDGDNVLESNETVISTLSGSSTDIFTGNWLAIADTSGNDPDVPLAGGSTHYIGKGWCFGTITGTPVAQEPNQNGPTSGHTGFTCSGVGNHNDAQTDGISVDVSFYAEQSRNNPGFLCSSLTALNGTAGRPVGAKLAAYQIPTQCAVTVNGADPEEAGTPNTIQAGVNAAQSGETVCVADGQYGETVTISTPNLILASLTGPTNTATINGGVIINAANVTVTGFKVIPGNTEGETAGFYLKEAADNATITYNDIDGTSVGGSTRGIINVINTDLPDVSIENNWIRNLTTGVYLNPHTGNRWMIRYNDIDNNEAGIGELNGALVVANEFEHTTAGSEAIGAGPSYDVGSNVTNNNFLNETKVKKYGAWPTLDNNPPLIGAQNNFWNLGGVSQTAGAVDYTPEAGVQFPHN